MSAEVTLDEKKTLMLIKLRKYKLIDREEKKGIISFLIEIPKEHKKVLIWCITTGGTVGVRYIDQLDKAIKEVEAEEGVIVTSGKYTPAAKVKSVDKNIELIPKTFPSFNIFTHKLVPKHEILTSKEKDEVLAKYKVQPYQLPWIKKSDPAAIAIGAKPGNVLKIIRDSPTAGKYISYRYVVEG